MKRRWWPGILLIVLTLAAYAPVFEAQFVNYDDIEYVTGNVHVNSGLSVTNFIWAFSTFHASNWHPLTWLSHQMDCALFGADAAAHHGMNLLWHVAAGLMLFALMLRLTRRVALSFMVAGLFLLHPLNVESVAWIAERKNTLSTFFLFAAVLTWAGHIEKPSRMKHAAALALFALGLMAKQMLVTLPFLLLILDFWPLQRPGSAATGAKKASASAVWRRLVWEKRYFFLLSLLAGIAVLLAQAHGGAVQSLESVGPGARIGNAVHSIFSYIGKMVWPRDLAVMYPHPRNAFTSPVVLIALLALLAITQLLWRLRRKAPYGLAGWLWYVVALAPVIGIIQVGLQARADRYAYVPLVGLFIMLVFAGEKILSRLKAPPPAQFLTGLGILVILGGVTWRQARVWENSISLFDHAARVTRDNDLAHLNLGVALYEEGRAQEAMVHFEEAIRIRPQDDSGYNNLGYVLLNLDRLEEAAPLLRRALALDAANPAAHNNLGKVLFKQGRHAEALTHFESAVRLLPGFQEAENNRRETRRVLEMDESQE